MHLSSVYIIASAATFAAATGLKRELPVTVPLLARAVTGAEYECHADCGYAILNAANEGYCTDQDWLDDLSGCLKCGLVYNIWQYYGAKVAAAAEACGLDATPSPATTEVATASSTEAASTTQSSQNEVSTTESQLEETTTQSRNEQTTTASEAQQTTTTAVESHAEETTTGKVATTEITTGYSTTATPTHDATTEQTSVGNTQAGTISDELNVSTTKSASENSTPVAYTTSAVSTFGSSGFSVGATGTTYLTTNSSLVSHFSGVASGTGATTTVITSVTPGVNGASGNSDSNSATSVPSSVVVAGASKSVISGCLAIGAVLFLGANFV